jgi:hypothetical protein
VVNLHSSSPRSTRTRDSPYYGYQIFSVSVIWDVLFSFPNHVLHRKSKNYPMGRFNRVLLGLRALVLMPADYCCSFLKREIRVLAIGTSFNQAFKRTRLRAVAIRMC